MIIEIDEKDASRLRLFVGKIIIKNMDEDDEKAIKILEACDDDDDSDELLACGEWKFSVVWFYRARHCWWYWKLRK